MNIVIPNMDSNSEEEKQEQSRSLSDDIHKNKHRRDELKEILEILERKNEAPNPLMLLKRGNGDSRKLNKLLVFG